jgi:hypothetical protein
MRRYEISDWQIAVWKFLFLVAFVHIGRVTLEGVFSVISLDDFIVFWFVSVMFLSIPFFLDMVPDALDSWEAYPTKKKIFVGFFFVWMAPLFPFAALALFGIYLIEWFMQD